MGLRIWDCELTVDRNGAYQFRLFIVVRLSFVPGAMPRATGYDPDGVTLFNPGHRPGNIAALVKALKGRHKKTAASRPRFSYHFLRANHYHFSLDKVK